MSNFPTRRKLGRTIPFGYKLSKDDNKLLLPIDSELIALEQAKIYNRSCSHKECAAWLSAKTGRYLSELGFRKIVLKEKKAKEKKYYESRKERERRDRAAARAAKTQAQAQEES